MTERKHPLAKCELCPLANRPYVPSYVPPGDINVIVVAEAPGHEETVKGRPLVGPSGQLLAKAVKRSGEDPNHMARLNVCCCRPERNEDPDPTAIWACLPRLTHELAQIDQKRVLTLGKVATETLLPLIGQSEAVKTNVSTRRGRWYQHTSGARLHKAVMPTWHPAYVLRKPTEAPQMFNDVAKAFKEDPDHLHNIHKTPQVIIPETLQQLEALLAKCPDDAWVAFDIETTNVQWYPTARRPADTIMMVQLCWDTSFGVVISDILLYDWPGTTAVMQRFFERVKVTAHNGKFDVVFCRSQLGWGEWCRVDFDTMLAHYALDETEKHGLKILAQEIFGLPDYEADLIKEYLRSVNDDYGKIPFDKLAQYAVWDVAVTLELRERFWDALEEEGRLEWPMLNLLMPAQDRFTKSQLEGIPIDPDYLTRAAERLQAEMDDLVAKMRAMAGKPDLNPNAPQQVAVVLYDDLGLPVPPKDRKSKKKTNRPTDHAARSFLAGMHPFVDLLAQYRRVAKIRSSYLVNLFDYIDLDGRVHPDFVVIGTEVGRLAMRDPAAQTIPRPSDYYGAVARGAFAANVLTEAERHDPRLQGGDDEFVFVIADFSQAELRAAAHYSQEPFLIRVYDEDRDLHDEGTYSMFGKPEDVGGYRAWKERRVNVKMFNFAYLYGGNEYSFAQDSGLPIDQARDFVRRYEANMPVLAQWKREQFAHAIKHGYVDTIFGRRRHFPVIDRGDRALMDEIRKASVHAVVAGTASDLTTLAAIELIDAGINVVLMVHDSIIVRCLRSCAAEVSRQVESAMLRVANHYLDRVKWKADAEITSRWATPPQFLTSRGIEYMPPAGTKFVPPATAYETVIRAQPSLLSTHHELASAMESAWHDFEAKQSFGNQEVLIAAIDQVARATNLYQSNAWQDMFVQ